MPTHHRHRHWGWLLCVSALVVSLTTLTVGVIVGGGHINGVGGRGLMMTTEVVVVTSMTLVVGCCHCRWWCWWPH